MMKRPRSTTSVKKKNNQFNISHNNNYINYNDTNIRNHSSLNQSPKLYTGKMRHFFESKKFYSMLDIDDKRTINKGPSLPIQFKRLSPKEIKEILNWNFAKIYDKSKTSKHHPIRNAFLKRTKIIKENNNDSSIFNQQSNINNSENEKVDDEINNTENKIKYIAIQLNKKDDCVKRPKSAISYKKKTNDNDDLDDNNNNKNQNIKKDRWMPAGYRNYEKIVKDRALFIKKMKENPLEKNKAKKTINEINSRLYDTDILFVKQKKMSDKLNNCKNNRKSNYYYQSDIFNIKNDDISLNKVGEKYLFNVPQKIKYTTSRESNSEWHKYVNKNSINNCSSKEYNILAPNRRNNSAITSEKIYKSLNDINNSKKNPIYKQHAVSNYSDVIHSYSSNFGKDYTKCYNLNPNCFKKIRGTCSSFGDLYLYYKDLCDKPFTEKSFLIK